METVNWNMVTAITSIMSIVMAGIATIIVFITRWIFITKKEAMFFVGRKEYEKEIKKIWVEIKDIIADLVRRPEWEKSKAYRERRIDENQRTVCLKIDKITESIKDMNKAHEKTNKSLNNMMGSFKTYLELKGHNDIQS